MKTAFEEAKAQAAELPTDDRSAFVSGISEQNRTLTSRLAKINTTFDTLETKYEGVDLEALGAARGLRGIVLQGTASGRNTLVWRLGRFADREGDEGLTWRARIEEMMWRTLVETGAGIAAEVLALVPNALPVFERLGDDVGAALAWQAIAGAHSHLGQHASSLEAAERALAHGERAGDDSLVHAAFRFVGVAAIWGPMPLAEAEGR